MSNIVIDTSERSLEEQIEAAIRHHGFLGGPILREMMSDFAAGKFAKAPVPEIRKPKWAADAWVNSNLHHDGGHVYETFYVEANEHRRGGPCTSSVYMIGPSRRTAREAILAFNDLFGGTP